MIQMDKQGYLAEKRGGVRVTRTPPSKWKTGEEVMANKALVPAVQKEVVFYEDMITAVLVTINGEDQIYVPLRPICDYLGLSYAGQREHEPTQHERHLWCFI